MKTSWFYFAIMYMYVFWTDRKLLYQRTTYQYLQTYSCWITLGPTFQLTTFIHEEHLALSGSESKLSRSTARPIRKNLWGLFFSLGKWCQYTHVRSHFYVHLWAGKTRTKALGSTTLNWQSRGLTSFLVAPLCFCCHFLSSGNCFDEFPITCKTHLCKERIPGDNQEEGSVRRDWHGQHGPAWRCWLWWWWRPTLVWQH